MELETAYEVLTEPDSLTHKSKGERKVIDGEVTTEF